MDGALGRVSIEGTRHDSSGSTVAGRDLEKNVAAQWTLRRRDVGTSKNPEP